MTNNLPFIELTKTRQYGKHNSQISHPSFRGDETKPWQSIKHLDQNHSAHEQEVVSEPGDPKSRLFISRLCCLSEITGNKLASQLSLIKLVHFFQTLFE